MFETAKKNVDLRIVEGRVFLSSVATADATKQAPATCRGLLFVQLYGIYEYAVHMSVQAALDTVRAESLSCSAIRKSLLALILDPKWKSAEDTGQAKVWGKRIELIYSMSDDKPIAEFNDTLFPRDGSHYRAAQLMTIWRVFGISLPILPSPWLTGRIDELVENRNAIAHGRETAREVGVRYTNDDMKMRISDTDTIAHYVIDTMKTHCVTGGLKS